MSFYIRLISGDNGCVNKFIIKLNSFASRIPSGFLSGYRHTIRWARIIFAYKYKTAN